MSPFKYPSEPPIFAVSKITGGQLVAKKRHFRTMAISQNQLHSIILDLLKKPRNNNHRKGLILVSLKVKKITRSLQNQDLKLLRAASGPQEVFGGYQSNLFSKRKKLRVSSWRGQKCDEKLKSVDGFHPNQLTEKKSHSHKQTNKQTNIQTILQAKKQRESPPPKQEKKETTSPPPKKKTMKQSVFHWQCVFPMLCPPQIVFLILSHKVFWRFNCFGLWVM